MVQGSMLNGELLTVQYSYYKAAVKAEFAIKRMSRKKKKELIISGVPPRMLR